VDARSRASTEEYQEILRDIYRGYVGDLIDAGDAPEVIEAGRAQLQHVMRHDLVPSLPLPTDDERDLWTSVLLRWLEDDHRAGGTLGHEGPQMTRVTVIGLSALPGDETA
jgi:hypothetical protein